MSAVLRVCSSASQAFKKRAGGCVNAAAAACDEGLSHSRSRMNFPNWRPPHNSGDVMLSIDTMTVDSPPCIHLVHKTVAAPPGLGPTHQGGRLSRTYRRFAVRPLGPCCVRRYGRHPPGEVSLFKHPVLASEHHNAPDDATDTHDGEDVSDWLRCAQCAHPIVQPAARVEVQGGHTHAFANPGGYFFRIGCFADAPGCVVSGELTAEFSWFVGYAWDFASCQRCGQHLGWRYLASSKASFFGLILDRLRSQNAQE